jgi:hypothetical protein
MAPDEKPSIQNSLIHIRIDHEDDLGDLARTQFYLVEGDNHPNEEDVEFLGRYIV